MPKSTPNNSSAPKQDEAAQDQVRKTAKGHLYSRKNAYLFAVLTAANFLVKYVDKCGSAKELYGWTIGVLLPLIGLF